MRQGGGSSGALWQTEAPDLSIWRKPAQPASSRSKAVDSTAAHRFQTGYRNGWVFPFSDMPDRFYWYGYVWSILPGRGMRTISVSSLFIYSIKTVLLFYSKTDAIDYMSYALLTELIVPK